MEYFSLNFTLVLCWCHLLIPNPFLKELSYFSSILIHINLFSMNKSSNKVCKRHTSVTYWGHAKKVPSRRLGRRRLLFQWVWNHRVCCHARHLFWAPWSIIDSWGNENQLLQFLYYLYLPLLGYNDIIPHVSCFSCCYFIFGAKNGTPHVFWWSWNFLLQFWMMSSILCHYFYHLGFLLVSFWLWNAL